MPYSASPTASNISIETIRREAAPRCRGSPAAGARPVGEAGLGDALAREVELLAREGQRGDAAAESRAACIGEPAPAAADLEHAVAGPEPSFAQHARGTWPAAPPRASSRSLRTRRTSRSSSGRATAGRTRCRGRSGRGCSSRLRVCRDRRSRRSSWTGRGAQQPGSAAVASRLRPSSESSPTRSASPSRRRRSASPRPTRVRRAELRPECVGRRTSTTIDGRRRRRSAAPRRRGSAARPRRRASARAPGTEPPRDARREASPLHRPVFAATLARARTAACGGTARASPEAHACQWISETTSAASADSARARRGATRGQRPLGGRERRVEVAAPGLVEVIADAQLRSRLGEPPGVALVHRHERRDVEPLLGVEDARAPASSLGAGRSTYGSRSPKVLLTSATMHASVPSARRHHQNETGLKTYPSTRRFVRSGSGHGAEVDAVRPRDLVDVEVVAVVEARDGAAGSSRRAAATRSSSGSSSRSMSAM